METPQVTSNVVLYWTQRRPPFSERGLVAHPLFSFKVPENFCGVVNSGLEIKSCIEGFADIIWSVRAKLVTRAVSKTWYIKKIMVEMSKVPRHSKEVDMVLPIVEKRKSRANELDADK
jgi:hypothetical protein